MIELEIFHAYKRDGSKSQFYLSHKEKKEFKDIPTAKEWIKSTYGNSKRVSMYRDTKNPNQPQKIGYVISFKDKQFNQETRKNESYVFQELITFYQKEVLTLWTT